MPATCERRCGLDEELRYGLVRQKLMQKISPSFGPERRNAAGHHLRDS